MGAYDSHFTGQITITPPLSWQEIKHGRHCGLQDLRLVLDEQTTDTDAGQTRVIRGAALAPLEIYRYGGLEIPQEIQSFIDAHPGHEFAGTIEAQPEDPAGMPWRYTVRGRRVVTQRARLVWDDEEAQR